MLLDFVFNFVENVENVVILFVTSSAHACHVLSDKACLENNKRSVCFAKGGNTVSKKSMLVPCINGTNDTTNNSSIDAGKCWVNAPADWLTSVTLKTITKLLIGTRQF